MISVRLKFEEMVTASAFGCARQIQALIGNYQGWDNTQSLASQWYSHICGAMAEFAVAKHFNKFIGPNLKQFNTEDIAGFGGVRWTEYVSGHLMLHKQDKDETKYILVTGKPPLLNIVGWIYGYQGKQEKYFNSELRKPCFAIPQSDLIKEFW